MKALSIRQPWAWLIVNGQKRIENRGWNTEFRGEFLIHAGKGMTLGEYADARYAQLGSRRGIGDFPSMDELKAVRGGIVGIARLVDVLKPTARPTTPWHVSGQYGFVLKDVRPLPFEPLKGALGFFEVER